MKTFLIGNESRLVEEIGEGENVSRSDKDLIFMALCQICRRAFIK
jgi:hypothetical protein